MIPLKIIFFILASFFGVETGKIAADKTTITVSPGDKKIEIVQEELFAFIQSDEDSLKVREEWDRLINWSEKETGWSEMLNNFSSKKISFASVENKVQPHLTLSYSTETDLQALEIEYDRKDNKYLIENTPDYNITTKDGELIDDHWVFCGDSVFSFTIEPFLEMPSEYQQFKQPLGELVG